RARGHLLRPELLAAPGAEDDVRRAPYHFRGVRQDALLRQRLGRALGEDVVAAGDRHQFRDPADAGDRRLVPLLEIDPRPTRQRRGLAGNFLQPTLQFIRVCVGTRAGTDQGAQAADVINDPVDAAVVGNPHLHPAAHQLGGDVGLDVGKADRQVRLELEDLADLGAGARAYLGLFLARLRRAHGEAADADDPVLLAERVQGLGRLFGQADDAPGAAAHGYSIRRDQAPSAPRS